jgi:hypothetical protein
LLGKYLLYILSIYSEIFLSLFPHLLDCIIWANYQPDVTKFFYTKWCTWCWVCLWMYFTCKDISTSWKLLSHWFFQLYMYMIICKCACCFWKLWFGISWCGKKWSLGNLLWEIFKNWLNVLFPGQVWIDGFVGNFFSNPLYHDTKDLYHTFLNILIIRRKNKNTY